MCPEGTNMQVATYPQKPYQKLITLLVVFGSVGGRQGVLVENKSLGFIFELMVGNNSPSST